MKELDLQSFVSKALVEISKGVSTAQNEIEESETGHFVSPENKDTSHAVNTERVSFDIAVTSTESETSEGGVGIKVVGVRVGGDLSENVQNSSISRISFSVPIGFTAFEHPKMTEKREKVAKSRQTFNSKTSNWMSS